MRLQQFIKFGRYGCCCQFAEEHLFCERTSVQNPHPVEVWWFFAETHPARTVVVIQLDDGDAQAT